MVLRHANHLMNDVATVPVYIVDCTEVYTMMVCDPPHQAYCDDCDSVDDIVAVVVR